MDEMKREHDMNMGYKKSWRAKEKALEILLGLDAESYALLPSFAYMLEANNPGLIIALETEEIGDEDKGMVEHFKYFFRFMSAFIQGWPHCKPVIIVDGSFLKSYYCGTLFTACAIDANEQVFPLAFGICDSENNVAWVWFLTKLKEAIGDRDDLIIISAKADSIAYAIGEVYPNAYHGFCMHHLLNNVRNKFRNVSKAVKWKFMKAAKAYTIREWENYMNFLDLEDPGIPGYLVSNEVGDKRWARCHFNDRRYSIMTSNNAELFNAVDVKPREFSVRKLLEFLRGRMHQWFYNRQLAAAGMFTILATNQENRLLDIHAASTGMIVRTVGDS